MKITHRLLTHGKDVRHAEERVRRFFRDYELIFYDKITYSEDIISASSSLFWEEANRAIGKNREVINRFLLQLSEEGYRHFADLAKIPQGYLSKIFHTMAHLLDGFFGVDSHFYNLSEGSHWISRKLLKEIEMDPEHYWLVKAVGSSSVSQEAAEIFSDNSGLKNRDLKNQQRRKRDEDQMGN
jgi:hypothetical protein